MWTYKKMIAFSTLSGLFLLAGCMEMTQPLDALNPDARQKTGPVAAKQFQEGTPGGPTAIESAIELSNKYAVLSEQAAQLQAQNQNLTEEKNLLLQQMKGLETEANQAKKELGEANDLLIEMRIELNNWKTDVLGFRDEMRQADKAQLETLVKILKVLGGEEVETNTRSEQPAAPATNSEK